MHEINTFYALFHHALSSLQSDISTIHTPYYSKYELVCTAAVAISKPDDARCSADDDHADDQEQHIGALIA